MPKVIAGQLCYSATEAARQISGPYGPSDVLLVARRFPELGAALVGRRWWIPARTLTRIARALAEHEPRACWRPEQDMRGRWRSGPSRRDYAAVEVGR